MILRRQCKSWGCNEYFPFALPNPLSTLLHARRLTQTSYLHGHPCPLTMGLTGPLESTGRNQRWGESEVGVFIPLALSLLDCPRRALSLWSPQLLLGFPLHVALLLTAPASQPYTCSQLLCLYPQQTAPALQASPTFVKSPSITLPSIAQYERAICFLLVSRLIQGLSAGGCNTLKAMVEEFT